MTLFGLYKIDDCQLCKLNYSFASYYNISFANDDKGHFSPVMSYVVKHGFSFDM